MCATHITHACRSKERPQNCGEINKTICMDILLHGLSMFGESLPPIGINVVWTQGERILIHDFSIA